MEAKKYVFDYYQNKKTPQRNFSFAEFEVYSSKITYSNELREHSTAQPIQPEVCRRI